MSDQGVQMSKQDVEQYLKGLQNIQNGAFIQGQNGGTMLSKTAAI